MLKTTSSLIAPVKRGATLPLTPWFKSQGWDLMWFQCSYWLVPFLCLTYFFISKDVFLFITALIFALVRLAHGYVTSYMCVAHPAYLQIAKKRPWSFYGIPALITLFFIIYFLVPQSLFPFTTYERLETYYFIAFPYIYVHYAGQHIGIFSMYRAKAGQKLSPFHKKFEKVYCHVVVSFTLTALNLNNFYDHSLGGVTWGDIFLVKYLNWNIIAWAMIFPFMITFLWLELRSPVRSVPKILYGLSLAVMSAVLTLDSFLFAWILIHLQHYFSHFGLCGHMLNNYDKKNRKEGDAPSLLQKYLVLIGVSLTIAFVHYHYQIVGSISGRYDVLFKDWIPLADPASTVRLLILGTFVGLGICHYYYDRLAFRFSDPEISKVLKNYLLED